MKNADHTPAAEGYDSPACVELFAGIGEVARAHLGELPPAGPVLAALEGRSLARPARREARLSPSGAMEYRLEADARTCSDITADDVIAVRSAPGAPLLVGRVIKVSVGKAGTVQITVRRLTDQARVFPLAGAAPSERHPALIFIPGENPTGRDDMCIVSTRLFVRKAPVEAYVGDDLCTFNFPQPREAGHGWMLVSFEFRAAVDLAQAA